VLRRFAPCLLLILLACIFFAPLVLHPAQVLYSDHSDMLAMHLPMKRFLVRSWQLDGKLPRWCPYSFGGMPFLSDVQVAAFYPLHAPLLWLPEESVGTAMSWLVLLHVLIAGFNAYAYGRHRGLGTPGSLTAAVGFMFAGKWLLHILAGGHYIMIPLAWLPLVLLFFERSVRRRSFSDAVYAGALFALIVLGTHPQITLYAGLVAASWSFCVLRDTHRDLPVRSWVSRWLLFGGLVAVTAVILSAVQLMPSIEAAGESSRGIGVPISEVLGVFGLAVREFFGPQSPATWEGSGGFGPVAFTLVLLAPLLRPGRFRWQMGCFAGLIVFSLGGAAVVQWLPGFRLFQIPVRMLLPAAFPAAFLCGVSVDSLVQCAPKIHSHTKLLWLCCGAALAINALAWPYPFLSDPEKLHAPLRPYVLYWSVEAGCVAVLCWILRDKIARGGLLQRGLLLGCVLAEAWALTWPHVAVRPIDSIYPLNPVVRRLAEARQASTATGPWRVLDRCVPDAASTTPLGSALPMFGSVRVEPILGYNSFDVRRYKELLQMIAGETEPLQPRSGLFGFPISDVFPIAHKSLLDLLGTKYLIQPYQTSLPFPDPEGPGSAGSWQLIEVFEKPGETYSFLTGGMETLPAYALYENMSAAPRAFMVHDWRQRDRHRTPEEMAETDFRKVLLLEEDSGVPAPNSSKGNDVVEFVSTRPDRIQLHVKTSDPGFLVLAETAYPGWQCSIDGSRSTIRRADFALQAVYVPAGTHEVIFEFQPRSLKLGSVLSASGMAGILLVFAGGILRGRKKKTPTDSQTGIGGAKEEAGIN
jgi:hypothetical protein